MVLKFSENLRKTLETVQNRLSGALGFFKNFRKIFGNLRKSSEVLGNYRKICVRDRNCSEMFAIAKSFGVGSQKHHRMHNCCTQDMTGSRVEAFEICQKFLFKNKNPKHN